jgi:hypothetical protein
MHPAGFKNSPPDIGEFLSIRTTNETNVKKSSERSESLDFLVSKLM